MTLNIPKVVSRKLELARYAEAKRRSDARELEKEEQARKVRVFAAILVTMAELAHIDIVIDNPYGIPWTGTVGQAFEVTSASLKQTAGIDTGGEVVVEMQPAESKGSELIMVKSLVSGKFVPLTVEEAINVLATWVARHEPE